MKNKLLLSIIIPTYNEKCNIENVIRKIDRAVVNSRWEAEIIVVDDNSPDGTAAVVNDLKKEIPGLRLLVRKNERGLSSAVVSGFKLSKGGILLVMDADLSHPPLKIPDIVKPLMDKKCDVAIASRYLRGDRTKGWTLSRKIISRTAGFLAGIITSVKDPTSGFFAIRRGVIKDVKLQPRGYKILLEIIGRGNYGHITEIPYTFTNRKYAKSKFGISVIGDYVLQLFSLLSAKNSLVRRGVVRNKKFFFLFLILLGITFPFLLVAHIDSYNRDDVGTFHAWEESWNQKTYLTDPVPNYPVIGLALSAGAMRTIKHIFNSDERNTSDLRFRYYLAFFDSLNFLLFVWIARLLRFRFPVFIGLILLVLPSTWAGGAVWGQIDNISLFLCLLSTVFFFKSWLNIDLQEKDKNMWKSVPWLFLGSLSLPLYILTKQLGIFSLPFFLFVFLVTFRKFTTGFRWAGLFCVLCSLIICVVLFHYADSLLAIPEGFHNSSYWFVWKGGGSAHSEKISGNGFNIWMFLGRDMWSSSRVPFFTLKLGQWKQAVSPYHTGIVLYLMLIVFLSLTAFRTIRHTLKRNIHKEQGPGPERYLLVLLCFLNGLSHLGFNVLLSGTHERYLYLGYPFLLIAVTWLSINRIVFSMRSILFCFFAAAAYGCFVFSTMTASLPGLLFILKRHDFLAAIHLFLLVFLLYMWTRTCCWGLKRQTDY